MLRQLFPLALASLLSIAAPGCADDALLQAPSDERADEGEDALSIELTEKYGLRPRRYGGLFNNSNEAEQRFAAHLPGVTRELNQRALELGFDMQLTDSDLAINFISEGGYFLLADDFTDSDYDNDIYIDGFTYLGVDTFFDNWSALEPWFTKEFIRAIDDGELFTFETTNELGQTVNSIVVQTIEQGLEANAIVYAWSRARFMSDLAAENKTTYESLAPEPRFFWSTMYYNAGVGFGRARLSEHGADYWQEKWIGPDDHATQSRFARYNALWRTSTFEYLKRTTLAE